MNEKDIKKCIKNGKAYLVIIGNNPSIRIIERKPFPNRSNWLEYLNKELEHLYATKREAQIAISKRREQARVDALKADGTQVPPPETSERRDVRLKATYEGYCKAGGPITKEQLTDEMRSYLNRTQNYVWKSDNKYGVIAVAERFVNDVKNMFWAEVDADHDHFLRTWKGPLTEEAAKALFNGDVIYIAKYNGTTQMFVFSGDVFMLSQVYAFLSESEALSAAHDLWLADRRENQMEPISEEQARMMDGSEDIRKTMGGFFVPASINGKDVPHDIGLECYFFSAKAAQSALDKAKQHEHRFADMPSWCPRLPKGYVPLGMGRKFKTLGTFLGLLATKDSFKWSKPVVGSSGFDGEFTLAFYIAPRDSEVALLNYPWLKDEAVASRKTPVGETQAKEVIMGETQIRTTKAKDADLPNGVPPVPDGYEFVDPKKEPNTTTDNAHDWLMFVISPTELSTEWKHCPYYCSSNSVFWYADPSATSGMVSIYFARPKAKPVAPIHTTKAKQEADGWTQDEIDKAAFKDNPISHPAHYTKHPSGIECIQITEHMGFCLGNAIKYIWRADLKNDAIEDLKKAAWYINREIEKRTTGNNK